MILFLDDNPGSAGFVPAADAGDAQTAPPGARVVLDGRASADSGPWKSNVAWAWTQVDVRGEVVDPPTVTLTGTDTATPAFTAPAAAGPLHFRLTVTGRGGDHTASDTVTVTVASSTAQMDASLASLAVTHAGAPVALTPAFSPGTDRYRARPRQRGGAGHGGGDGRERGGGRRLARPERRAARRTRTPRPRTASRSTSPRAGMSSGCG